MNRKKVMKFLLILACLMIILIGCLSMYNYTTASNIFTLTATPRPEENGNRGAINLDWSSYSGENVIFKGYQSTQGGAENSWNSISLMDYTVVSDVRVLQIYPDTGQGQLKQWMITNGYGKNIIKVGEVSMTNFNNNPRSYLTKDTKGAWNYDVIFFGTADRNNYFDLSSASYAVVDQFIQEGYGCIFGHDTILNNAYFNTDSRETLNGSRKKGQTNFDALAKKYFKSLSFGSTQNNQLYYGGTHVQIVKNGLFTTYPWPIGEIGDVLEVPNCHTWGQIINPGYEGNVWLRFQEYDLNANYNFYLITENNVSMIQTGHSNRTSNRPRAKNYSKLNI